MSQGVLTSIVVLVLRLETSQSAKKVLSDSPGLVDFSVGLVHFIHHSWSIILLDVTQFLKVNFAKHSTLGTIFQKGPVMYLVSMTLKDLIVSKKTDVEPVKLEIYYLNVI